MSDSRFGTRIVGVTLGAATVIALVVGVGGSLAAPARALAVPVTAESLTASWLAASPPAATAVAAPVISGDGGGIADDGSGSDSKDRNAKLKGPVTFGLQPASVKAPDLRTTWTYQDLKPGQLVVDHAAVLNVTNQPVTLSVYAADGKNTTAGGYSVVPTSKSSLDVGAWVKLARSQVTVPAHSSVVMPFTLTVPRNAEPGDHAGGIVASLRTFAKDAKGNTVSIENRVGTRLYVRVAGKLVPRIRVDHLEPHYEGGGVSGDATVTFTVHNEGNVRLMGRQSVRITDVLGGNIVAKDVPELPELLPQNSFTFSVKALGLKPVGYFTALVTVDPQSVTGNVDPVLQQANAQQSFTGLSAGVMTLAGAVALGLGWVVIRRRLQAGDGFGPLLARVRRRRRTAAGAAAAILPLLLLAAMATGQPAAQAADGSMTFIPATGQDISPMYAVTSGACPAEATNIVAQLTGPGFPAAGITVVSNTRAGVRHDGGFGVPLQNAMHNFAAMNGVSLHGAYTMRLRCIDHLAQHSYATYQGVITFSDPNHYSAPSPKEPPAYGVPVPLLLAAFPGLAASAAAAPPLGADAGAATPGASGQSELTAPSAQNGQVGQVGHAGEAVQPATSGAAAGSGDNRPFLYAALVLLLAAAAYLAASRRRQDAPRPESTVAPLTWPDQ
jgi:hypothetical protein